MFKDNLLFCEYHEDIASSIASAYKTGVNIGSGLVVCIFGISGTGKSEVAWWLARKLYCMNFSSHVVALDRFYKVPVLEREDHRRRTKIIGSEEMDWVRVDEEVNTFKDLKKIDVLIVEGLYAGYIDKSNLRVYIEGDIDSTYAFRKLRGKQNPDSEWRKFVLDREKDAVYNSVKDEDECYSIRNEYFHAG